MRQRNTASGTSQGPEKNKYNKYTKMAITNNFVALKHGHIVATELSRAQLW